jgi:sodium/proline symporter
VLSLFWRGMTRMGALAGIIAGGLTVVIWKALAGGIFELYEIVPGILAATLAVVIGSRLSKPTAPEILARFARFRGDDLRAGARVSRPDLSGTVTKSQ